MADFLIRHAVLLFVVSFYTLAAWLLTLLPWWEWDITTTGLVLLAFAYFHDKYEREVEP